jgi:hypothetical protein
MIKDFEGNEIVYWPITGLASGEQSETIVIRIATPVVGYLRAESNDKVSVWARVQSQGTFVNISETPIDLSNMLGAEETAFEIYVEAAESIDGLERIPISVLASKSRSAGWII